MHNEELIAKIMGETRETVEDSEPEQATLLDQIAEEICERLTMNDISFDPERFMEVYNRIDLNHGLNN